jgi:hypothetical protein
LLRKSPSNIKIMRVQEAVKRPETVCSKKLKATVLIRGLLKLLQYGR